jgi:hypothetical protein
MTANKRFGQRFSQRPQRILYQVPSTKSFLVHVTNLALFSTRYCVCVCVHTQCTHRCTRTGIYYCTYPNKKVEMIEQVFKLSKSIQYLYIPVKYQYCLRFSEIYQNFGQFSNNPSIYRLQYREFLR